MNPQKSPVGTAGESPQQPPAPFAGLVAAGFTELPPLTAEPAAPPAPPAPASAAARRVAAAYTNLTGEAITLVLEDGEEVLLPLEGTSEVTYPDDNEWTMDAGVVVVQEPIPTAVQGWPGTRKGRFVLPAPSIEEARLLSLVAHGAIYWYEPEERLLVRAAGWPGYGTAER